MARCHVPVSKRGERMALQIIRNNIVNVEADAIVNTANPKVAVGRGVERAI